MAQYFQPAPDRGKYRGFGFTNSSEKVHCAHDYNCDAGTVVKSISLGKVIFSGAVNGFGGYGRKKAM